MDTVPPLQTSGSTVCMRGAQESVLETSPKDAPPPSAGGHSHWSVLVSHDSQSPRASREPTSSSLAQWNTLPQRKVLTSPVFLKAFGTEEEGAGAPGGEAEPTAHSCPQPWDGLEEPRPLVTRPEQPGRDPSSTLPVLSAECTGSSLQLRNAGAMVLPQAAPSRRSRGTAWPRLILTCRQMENHQTGGREGKGETETGG